MLGVGYQTAAHGIAQAVGLFEYLLQHKVVESALAQFGDVHIYRLHVKLTLLVVVVHDVQAVVEADVGYLSVVQIHHLVGVLHYWRCVAGYKEFFFVLAYSHNKRTRLACRNEMMRILLLRNNDGIGAYHVVKGRAYRLQQFGAVIIIIVVD